MFELKVKDTNGKTIEKISVDDNIFGGKGVRSALLQEAVVMYEANKRLGTVSTKDVGAVSGSRKKPWKQKHTGRARAGTVKSSIWVGGGTAHGPLPRDFSYSIGKTTKKEALKSALFAKFANKKIVVVDDLSLEKPKTKDMYSILKNLKLTRGCLVAVCGDNQNTEDNTAVYNDKNILLSARNIPNVSVMRVADLNAFEVLKTRKILFTKNSLASLQEKLKK